MKKWIVFLLIFLILISIIFVALDISNPKGNKDSKTNAIENQDNEITGNIVKDDSENKEISGNAVSDGSSEAGNSSSSSPEESSENINEEKGLPTDLYTRPCGYYFLEYKVCAGICPDGQCLVDKKSCYCRVI